VVEPALSIVQAEQQRSDLATAGFIAEAANHAIGRAHPLTLTIARSPLS
jgi:hypothetical protein